MKQKSKTRARACLLFFLFAFLPHASAAPRPNILLILADDLVAILNHVRATFPEVKRITSYARSHTIARISDENMARLAAAGLNRIHIGMESASDAVLEFVKKGVDKATHIAAGQKVKRAGFELSEYFMPGLGGEALSRENALETADALNQTNPDCDPSKPSVDKQEKAKKNRGKGAEMKRDPR